MNLRCGSIIVILISAALLAACASSRSAGRGLTPPTEVPHPARFEFTRLAMGDRARIIVYAGSEEAGRAAAAAALDRIAELEAVMTDYRPDSELMRLCARGGGGGGDGEPVAVSEDLFGVLWRAKQVAELTGGAFDPTMGPVVRLWRESRRRGVLPDEEAVREAMLRVGHEKMVLDPEARTVRLLAAGMQLDLGGIGKGYAADAASRVLDEHGFGSHLVAVGGDIVAGDAPPGREAWAVRVTTKSGEGESVPLVRAAISTSGDLEQFIEIDGVRYSHIVSPRTGVGLTERWLVTVIAPDGTTADAVATAASVLGPEGVVGLAEAEWMKGLWVRMEGDRRNVERGARR